MPARARIPRLLSAALVIMLIAGCGGVPIRPEKPDQTPSESPASSEVRPLPGYRAPNVMAQDVFSKSQVSLWGLQGQVVVLNFWATWCPPCKVEMPEMEAFHQETKGKVRIIAVGADRQETPEVMAAFAREMKLSFTIAYDGAAAVDSYQVVGIPTSVVIDQKGIIRARHSGAVNLKLLRQWTAEAERLGEK